MRLVIAEGVDLGSFGRSVSPRPACGAPRADGRQGGAGTLVDRTPAGDSSAADVTPLYRGSAASGGEVRDVARWRVDQPVALVRFLVAVLLLTSAILKAFSPAESATLAAGYSIPPWLTVAAVQLELLVAAALVFGCWQRWTLRFTIGLFSVFAAFSLYRAPACIRPGGTSYGGFNPITTEW